MEGKTAVHIATNRGYIIAFDFLTKEHANLNAVDNCKKTALHVAAEKGVAKTVKRLIDLGADTSLKDEEGHTAYEACLKEEKSKHN
ncbi:TPA: ankyrin repeat domain-containing protein [Legionella anisa]|uniref:ankyrin repeat domain-containing protein n=1 Tax=Legionella TaxID=445 RepID=UPI002239289B|nr:MULTISPECIES: ankyrin repeat domain-containing protein [Legionella]